MRAQRFGETGNTTIGPGCSTPAAHNRGKATSTDQAQVASQPAATASSAPWACIQMSMSGRWLNFILGSHHFEFVLCSDSVGTNPGSQGGGRQRSAVLLARAVSLRLDGRSKPRKEGRAGGYHQLYTSHQIQCKLHPRTSFAVQILKCGVQNVQF